jgi:hypothetical protein
VQLGQGGLTVAVAYKLQIAYVKFVGTHNRKRPLTLAMIRKLHHGLGIPAHVLIAETVVG